MINIHNNRRPDIIRDYDVDMISYRCQHGSAYEDTVVRYVVLAASFDVEYVDIIEITAYQLWHNDGRIFHGMYCDIEHLYTLN